MAVDSILFEMTFTVFGPKLRAVMCAEEKEVEDTYRANMDLKAKGPKARMWLYCDLDWAEYAGFIQRG